MSDCPVCTENLPRCVRGSWEAIRSHTETIGQNHVQVTIGEIIQSVEDTNTLHLHTSDLTLHTSHHFIVGEQPAGRGGGEDHGLHGGDQGEEEGQ